MTDPFCSCCLHVWCCSGSFTNMVTLARRRSSAKPADGIMYMEANCRYVYPSLPCMSHHKVFTLQISQGTY